MLFRSVWVKTTSPNSGANWVVKVYNSLTEQWNVAAAPIFAGDTWANAALDPNGGGKNIAAGTFFVVNDPLRNTPVLAESEIHVRAVTGPLVITGSISNPTFGANCSFSIGTSVPGVGGITNTVTVAIANGDNATAFVTKVLAKNLPYLTAQVNSNGTIQLSHTAGGVIYMANGSGTPLSTVGIDGSTQYVTLRNNNTLSASNWVSATYTASTATPAVDPADGTYWYDSATNEVDIMIHDGTAWKGYQTVTNDTRGYNLHLTDPAGPIVAAAMPMEQTDGSALEYGDLWIDTSDLENYPRIYRYDNVSGMGQWNLLDNSDQTSENGILFADARWGTDNTVDMVKIGRAHV